VATRSVSVEHLQPDLEAVEVEQRRRCSLYGARAAPTTGSTPRAGSPTLQSRASASRGLAAPSMVSGGAPQEGERQSGERGRPPPTGYGREGEAPCATTDGGGGGEMVLRHHLERGSHLR